MIPVAPPDHEIRNQNEYRRILQLKIDAILARLKAREEAGS